MHDLRHTCATLLLAQGVPAQVGMEILGHSQISITRHTYSHVAPALQHEAMAKMDDVLSRLLSGLLSLGRTSDGSDDSKPVTCGFVEPGRRIELRTFSLRVRRSAD